MERHSVRTLSSRKCTTTTGRTDAGPETVVDKPETHFGFLAEDVQKVMPDPVYDDIAGNALDIKWNNITALLVREIQMMRVDNATAQVAIDAAQAISADLSAWVEILGLSLIRLS
ncbi:hypothetical protein SARC_03635 [Sphaeroforma arctica JP610]|uniref:Peptidase S74 domain-containing protein n=1 Tax=Sphaeroforma arctica JP610 TaxID=667725 RepID=A0A0L0G528_9EUKA|nr:hypothetical protein SARC_03635 [Sphaeroforma arctica JP610]KNC84137.1 hypothetical protein SARC_03635 [Sphaeroforma arctica JP610]|eukprot:XP_014158039.1 hypothetical protein SARC_03635 [Sphaeroforma arctica JP610]